MGAEAITQAGAAITHSPHTTRSPHTTNNNIHNQLTTQRRLSKARPNQHRTTATARLSLLTTPNPRKHQHRRWAAHTQTRKAQAAAAATRKTSPMSRTRLTISNSTTASLAAAAQRRAGAVFSVCPHPTSSPPSTTQDADDGRRWLARWPRRW